MQPIPSEIRATLVLLARIHDELDRVPQSRTAAGLSTSNPARPAKGSPRDRRPATKAPLQEAV